MFKGELNYVIGNNLFLVGRYAHVKGGFNFLPQGGMDKQMYRDDSYVYHNSYWDYVTDRPQDAFVADANYFHGQARAEARVHLAQDAGALHLAAARATRSGRSTTATRT